eukprot:scaffold104107_cov45-Phaeocystis_antarctica.AAC.2
MPALALTAAVVGLSGRKGRRDCRGSQNDAAPWLRLPADGRLHLSLRLGAIRKGVWLLWP